MTKHPSYSAGLEKKLSMHLKRTVLRFCDCCLRYFDAARLMSAAQEKRKTRKKHIHEIPIAVNVVLYAIFNDFI